MGPRSRVLVASALLLGAAGARLLLQIAVMPPYAGLDEVFHVARLSFRLEERRNPNSKEASVPIYLHRSMNAAPGYLPAFGVLGESWPAKVPSILLAGIQDHIPEQERRAYYGANYEAQQPSLYYSIAAPVARFLARGTPLTELRLWRLMSAFFALTTVAATAWIAFHYYGELGILAAALLVSFPTWLTLVARASNDALACAFIAFALAVSVSSPKGILGWFLEGIAWAGALAIKLYSWPVLMVLPFLWRSQRAGKRRVALVAAFCLVAIAGTSWELSRRTGNPLGLFAFDPVSTGSTGPRTAGIDYVEMLKIFIATTIWTSGQHWNALTPLGMALYFGPIVLVMGWAIVRASRAELERRVLLLVGVVAISFAAAQIGSAAVNALRTPGSSLPVLGKEGWYWYAFAPILIGIPLSITFVRLNRRRAAIFAVVVWLLAWDVLIHEGALFRDYAGLTTPATRTPIFRWGPLEQASGNMEKRLDGLAVGPLTSKALELRMAHVAPTLVLALFVVIVRTNRKGATESPLVPKHEE